MTKEEAIKWVETAFSVMEGEYNTGSKERAARDMAIAALKRDDPEMEFQKRFEKSTFCGYSAKELLLFADVCRRSGITHEEMHEFCLCAESVYKYVLSKVSESLEKELLS